MHVLDQQGAGPMDALPDKTPKAPPSAAAKSARTPSGKRNQRRALLLNALSVVLGIALCLLFVLAVVEFLAAGTA